MEDLNESHISKVDEELFEDEAKSIQSLRSTTASSVREDLNAFKQEVSVLMKESATKMDLILSLIAAGQPKEKVQLNEQRDNTLFVKDNDDLMNLGGHNSTLGSSIDGMNQDKVNEAQAALNVKEQQKKALKRESNRRSSILTKNDLYVKEQIEAAQRSSNVVTFKTSERYGANNELKYNSVRSMGGIPDILEWLKVDESIKQYLIRNPNECVQVFQFVNNQRVLELLCSVFNDKVEDIAESNEKLTPEILKYKPYEEFKIYIQSAHRPESLRSFSEILLGLIMEEVPESYHRKMSVTIYNILLIHPILMHICRRIQILYAYLSLNNADNTPHANKGDDSIVKTVLWKIEPKVFLYVWKEWLDPELRKGRSDNEFKNISFTKIMAGYLDYFSELKKEAKSNVKRNQQLTGSNDDTKKKAFINTHARSKQVNNVVNVDDSEVPDLVLEYDSDELELVVGELFAERDKQIANGKLEEADVNALDNSKKVSFNDKRLVNTDIKKSYVKTMQEICYHKLKYGECNRDPKLCKVSSSDIAHKDENLKVFGTELCKQIMKSNNISTRDLTDISSNKAVTNFYNNNPITSNKQANNISTIRQGIYQVDTEKAMENINNINHALRQETFKSVIQGPYDMDMRNKDGLFAELERNPEMLKNQINAIKQLKKVTLPDFINHVRVDAELELKNGYVMRLLKAVLDSGALIWNSLLNTRTYKGMEGQLSNGEVKNHKIQLNSFRGDSDGPQSTVIVLARVSIKYKNSTGYKWSNQVVLPLIVTDLGPDTDIIIGIRDLAQHFVEPMKDIFDELGKVASKIEVKDPYLAFNNVNNCLDYYITQDGSKTCTIDLGKVVSSINMIHQVVFDEDVSEDGTTDTTTNNSEPNVERELLLNNPLTLVESNNLY